MQSEIMSNPCENDKIDQAFRGSVSPGRNPEHSSMQYMGQNPYKIVRVGHPSQ